MTTENRPENTTMSAPAVINATWDELLGHLLDLAGQRVSVSAGQMVVTRVVVKRTDIIERNGLQLATMHMGENVRLVFRESGLRQCGWIEDDSAPEREVFGVIDCDGEREVLLVLERS